MKSIPDRQWQECLDILVSLVDMAPYKNYDARGLPCFSCAICGENLPSHAPDCICGLSIVLLDELDHIERGVPR